MANMSYKLLVVESPTKAKTIGKYLGKDYEVLATVGHLRDLPKSKMGVDTLGDFDIDYEIDVKKKKVVAELQKAALKAQEVVLATDPDREGEAISWHVAHLLTKEGKKPILDKKIKRVTFHEITRQAVEKALESPRQIDENLVDAQQGRRVLDRLVGYELSPLLWKKVRRGLSAGRVQSVAVRLICEREEEIKKFKSSQFYRVTVKVLKGAKSFEAALVEYKDKKIDVSEKIKLFDGDYTFSRTVFENKAEVEKLVDALEKKYVVSEVKAKEVGRNPLPPYTTSKLQQAAASKFGWTGKLTMSVAQKLYEKGWISYHRTDSVYMSPQIVDSFREYLKNEHGEKYVPDKPRFYANHSKNAQEAHEAIRPTKVDRVVGHLVDARERKLYDLIWKRAVSSQAASACLAKTTLKLENNQAIFKAEGVRLLFDGYLKIYGHIVDEQELPVVKKGDELDGEAVNISEHTTMPPSRYGDASLVSSLERQGIGRPSTYAPIISTILTRMYVERVEGRFVPTVLGIAANEFLVKNFVEILSLPFTAEIEESLDKIALGKLKWKIMMKDFWKKFKPEVDKVSKNSERVKVAVESTGRTCPECQVGELVIRTGRFGKFISCNRFPDCRHTEQIRLIADFKCPKCGSEVVVKKTRKGRKFFGCGTYPKCDWAGWKKP